MTLIPRHRYVATVCTRRGSGFTVRHIAEALDGRRLTFTAGWLIEDEDAVIRPEYAGEVTMELDRDDDPGIGWIASGDLVDIVAIEALRGST